MNHTKLPRPGWAQMVRVRELLFCMEAPNKATARKWARALYVDMQRSLQLRRTWEIVPGIVGVGHAGIAHAKRLTRKEK